MLFGIPLLFTLEVWDLGSSTTPATLAAVVVVTFVPVTLSAHTAGFRRSKEMSLPWVLRKATEAVAVGAVAATGVLILLREITLQTPLADALGEIVYELAPFAIGAAVACHLISQSPDQTDDDHAHPEDRSTIRGTVADLGSTLVGALFVASNIAPTEKIPRLAAASSPPALLAVVAPSLLISFGIVSKPAAATRRSGANSAASCSIRSPKPSARTSPRWWPRPRCCCSSATCGPATHSPWYSTTSCSSDYPPPSVAPPDGSRDERHPATPDRSV